MKRWFLPVAVALALLAAACSSDGASSEGVASLGDTDDAAADAGAAPGDGAGGGAADQEQALMDFARCMREHDVPMEDPTVDADGNLSLQGGFRDLEGLDRETIRAARDTCAENLEGVALGFNQANRSELEDLFLEYAECMRAEGFTDMPDTLPRGPGGADDPGDGPQIDFEDPDFVAANEVCQEVFADSGIGRLPGGGPGRAGSVNGGNAS